MKTVERFWQIGAPDYGDEGDYRRILVNGTGSHPLSLPGIDCPTCGPWGGSRILPVQCPEKLRNEKTLVDRWPISIEQFKRITKELRRELPSSRIDFRPGDSFQPALVEFPSRPTDDFLWPSMCGPIIPPKVKVLFEKENVTGVEYCEVVVEKVGSKESTARIFPEEHGDPEEMVKSAIPDRRASEFGPLFEMVISSETGFPPGTKVVRVCEICGFIELDTDNHEVALPANQIPKSDIFFLGTTLFVIVTQRVADLIRSRKLSNVQLTEIRVR